METFDQAPAVLIPAACTPILRTRDPSGDR